MPIDTGFRINNTNLGYSSNTDLADIFIKRNVFDTGGAYGAGNTTILNQSTGVNSSPGLLPKYITWKKVTGTKANTRAVLAISRDGSLFAMGNNFWGTLGDGTTTSTNTFVDVLGFNGTAIQWVDVAAGEGHAAGITSDGKMWAWGLNSSGQLGQNNTTATSSPVSVITSGNAKWVYVTCGRSTTLGIKSDGTLWGAGVNNLGQLGDNATTQRVTMVSTVGGITSWKKVSAYDHTLGITADGTLYAWGYNGYGNLGDGTKVNKLSPVTVIGGLKWKTASAGSIFSAAITTDGLLYTWGGSFNQLGQGGVATSVTSPATVAGGGTTWKAVESGTNHSIALKSDGTLWAWGVNTEGCLMNGGGPSQNSPVSSILGSSVFWRQVSALGAASIALS